MNVNRKTLQKIISMTGERAKIDAKIYDTYIVYDNGQGIIREYPDGRKEMDQRED